MIIRIPTPLPGDFHHLFQIGLRFVARQGGGDLVQNEQIDTAADAVERDDEGHQSALRRTERARQAARIDVETEAFEHRRNVAVEIAPLHARPSDGKAAKRGNALRNRARVDQRGLLMDDGDAELVCKFRRGNVLKGLTGNLDLSVVGLVNARKDFHERRLAAAVGTEQRMDVAGTNRKPHVGQDQLARKRF